MPQGSLALYRRHLASCKHLDKGNRWTRCQCPIWVQGSIGGETIRRSLNTGNWTAASTIVHQWQSSGRIGVLKPELPSVPRPWNSSSKKRRAEFGGDDDQETAGAA